MARVSPDSPASAGEGCPRRPVVTGKQKKSIVRIPGWLNRPDELGRGRRCCNVRRPTRISSRLPLADPRALQHRHRRLRPPRPRQTSGADPLDETGRAHRYGFDDNRLASKRFANVLAAHGLARGDRLAVCCRRRPRPHSPTSPAFAPGSSPSALHPVRARRPRIPPRQQRRPGGGHDRGGAAILATLRDGCGAGADLLHRRPGEGAEDFHALCARASDAFAPLDTPRDRRSFNLHVRHTGDPKGALHAHRVLLGTCGGGTAAELFPQPGDRFWTPADWAWIGGLFDVLLPAWHHTACRWWPTAPASSTRGGVPG